MMILTLSDQSGTFECIAFSEQISQFGDMLQPGRSVILQVGAEERAEGISLRRFSAEPIDGVAEKVDRRLTIFAADMRALQPISAQLKRGGEGSVNFVVIRDGGAREYEIELPGIAAVGEARVEAGEAQIAEGVEAVVDGDDALVGLAVLEHALADLLGLFLGQDGHGMGSLP